MKIMNFINKSKSFRYGFTLAEIMIAVAVVAIVAGLTLPSLIGGADEKTLETLSAKMEKDIILQVDNLVSSEGVKSFNETSLVKTTDDRDYNDNAKKFLQKYFQVTKYCANGKDCFASKYKYASGNEYPPSYDGACGRLKNGASICIRPKYIIKDSEGKVTKEQDIWVLMDVNGPKKPNIFNQDIKYFYVRTDSEKAEIGYDDDESNENILDGTALVRMSTNCSESVEFNSRCCYLDSYRNGAHKTECCMIEPYSNDESLCPKADPEQVDPCSTAPTEYGDECCEDSKYSDSQTCLCNPNNPSTECCNKYKEFSACKQKEDDEKIQSCLAKIDPKKTYEAQNEYVEDCCKLLHDKDKLGTENGSYCCRNDSFREDYVASGVCTIVEKEKSVWRVYAELKCNVVGETIYVTYKLDDIRKESGDGSTPPYSPKIEIYLDMFGAVRGNHHYPNSGGFNFFDFSKKIVATGYPAEQYFPIDDLHSFNSCGFKSNTHIRFVEAQFQEDSLDDEQITSGGNQMSTLPGYSYYLDDYYRNNPIREVKGLYAEYFIPYSWHYRYKKFKPI